MKNNLTIRLETSQDYGVVENLVRESFWNVYRPGCSEHYVLHLLRDDADFVKQLDFVAELDGEIIGQCVFVKAQITVDNGTQIPVLTMGPICIAPQYQHNGYGKVLLDYCLDRATQQGYGAVLIEGNIDFYAKCGFTYASNFGIRYHGLPEGEDASFFLCKELQVGYLANVTGEYATPNAYFVDDNDVENFDKTFPPKTKLKLPTQLF